MNNLGKILAIIPARGGSKGVKDKNIRSISGKPLIAYTIETALKAKDILYRTIVSTDSAEIASVAKMHGADVPFLRPKTLSADNTKMLSVINHALKFVEKEDKTIIDWILLLQPTDPMREVGDIHNSIKLALGGGCDSVISVERVLSHHPLLMKKIVNDKIVPYFYEEKEGTPRQKYTPYAYMRNGSIYLFKRSNVVEMGSIWGKEIRPLIMEEGSRISIDSINDFKLVELLIKQRQEINKP